MIAADRPCGTREGGALEASASRSLCPPLSALSTALVQLVDAAEPLRDAQFSSKPGQGNSPSSLRRNQLTSKVRGGLGMSSVGQRSAMKSTNDPVEHTFGGCCVGGS
jgi:hypothetical protein